MEAWLDSPDVETLPVPRHIGAQTIAVPDDRGPGHWVGAPSALVHNGVHYLAYRRRRPVDDGRGGDVIVARVAADGVTDRALSHRQGVDGCGVARAPGSRRGSEWWRGACI